MKVTGKFLGKISAGLLSQMYLPKIYSIPGVDLG